MLTLITTLVGAVSHVEAQERTLTDYLGRAKELYGAGHFREAQLELQKAVAKATTLSRQDPVVTSQVELLSALCDAELGDGATSLEAFVEGHTSSPFINEALLALGLEHHEWGRWNETLESLERVDVERLSDSQAEELCFAAGHASYNLGDLSEATQWLSKVSKESEEYSHARYLLGYMAYVEGDYQEAKHIFSQLTDDAHYHSIMPYYLISIEYKMGNYTYVSDRCDEVLKGIDGGRRQELMRISAESNFRLERWAEAARHIETLEESVKLTREENYIAGYALYRLGEWDKAERYLRGACGAEDSLTRNAAYHLADCLLKVGDKRGALQCFSMVPLPEGDDRMSEDARYNQCKLFVELGVANFDEEIHSLANFLRRYPQSHHRSEIEGYLISACYSTQDLKVAYEILDEFSSSGGDVCKAMQSVAYYYAVECFEEGIMAEAEEYCLHSLDYMDYNEDIAARTLFLLGGINFHIGEYRVSAVNYKNYLDLECDYHPFYEIARYNMGYSRYAAGEYSEAVRIFEEFIEEYGKVDDFYTDAYNRMGDAEAAMNHFADAAKRYEVSAVSERRGAHYGAYRAAMMYGLAGDTTARIEALEKIIIKGSGPYLDTASFELATTLMSAGMFSRAVGVWDTYVATHPNSPNRIDAMGNLALAYRNLDRTEEALETYKRIVREAKGSVEASNAIGEVRAIYVEKNDVDGFIEYADKMGFKSDVGENQRDSLTFVAARRVYLSGDMATASSSFDKYLAEHPEGMYSNAALYYSAESKMAIGDSLGARSNLQKLTSMAYYNQYTQSGLERLAALEVASSNWAEATDSYRKVVELATTTSARRKALENYLSAAVSSGVGEMIVAATTYVCEHPEVTPELTRRAQLEEAKAKEKMGSMEEALSLYGTLKADVTTPEGAEASYREIQIRFAEHNYDAAEELVYEFSDKHTPEQMWLAKAFLLLGDIYVERGNLFQARATYQSIVDGYSNSEDGIIATAKERVESLLEQSAEPAEEENTPIE